MKDSHMYQRLNDDSPTRAIIMLINNGPTNLAHAIFNDITLQASDHPKYNYLKELYEARLNAFKE